MLHIVSDESLEEAALFITARCNNINYTNKLVIKYIFFYWSFIFCVETFDCYAFREKARYIPHAKKDCPVSFDVYLSFVQTRTYKHCHPMVLY